MQCSWLVSYLTNTVTHWKSKLATDLDAGRLVSGAWEADFGAVQMARFVPREYSHYTGSQNWRRVLMRGGVLVSQLRSQEKRK